MKQKIDFGTAFEFSDSRTGQNFCVTLATLLQCLCIAEQQHIVPPFETAWEVEAIPVELRAMAQCRAKE